MWVIDVDDYFFIFEIFKGYFEVGIICFFLMLYEYFVDVWYFEICLFVVLCDGLVVFIYDMLGVGKKM